MKNVFIDGGSHSGELFGIIKQDPRFRFINDCEIHLFEPNQRYYPVLESMCQTRPNTYLHKGALWIDECEKDFFESHERCGDAGNTLYRSSVAKIDVNTPTLVKCFDVNKFINSFAPDDNIVIKLDVEGSEYDILRRMYSDDNVLKRVKGFFIEWHDQWFPDANMKSYLITELYSKKNILLQTWPY